MVTSSAPGYVVCHARSTVMGAEIEQYLRAIDATLEPFGGRFVIHGGPVDVREGEWVGDLIVLEFPDRGSAADWYDSAAYRRIAPLRTTSTDSVVVVLDGVPRSHRATDILEAG